MGEIARFPAERAELARLRRAYDAELERMTELEIPLPDKRARKAARAYFKAQFRADGWPA